MAESDQKGMSGFMGTAMTLAALGAIFLGMWMSGQTLATSISAEGEANRVLIEATLNRVEGLTKAVTALSERNAEMRRVMAASATTPPPAEEGDGAAAPDGDKDAGDDAKKDDEG